MGIKKKLFPKKGEEKDKLVTDVKRHVRTLALTSKNYGKKAEISRQNAKIALQRGEKDRAKNYLLLYKQYQGKVDRANNIRAKFERQVEAIEEGSAIASSGNLMGKVRDELKEIATKASPTKVAEVSEDSEQYVSEIEEAGDILAGDLEVDLGMSVDDELNQLETEMLLEVGGKMPTVPSGDVPQYLTDVEDDTEKEGEIKSKDKLQAEIDKLRKELNE